MQPSLGLAGEILAVDIDLPADLAAWAGADVEVMDARTAAALLPVRPLDGHKGTFGTCLIVAGSVIMRRGIVGGAGGIPCGSGAGAAAVPGAIHEALAGSLPEATC